MNTTTEAVDVTDRDTAIRLIRAALKRRTGRSWSVKGGRGTAWGWITITAPPKRCTFGSEPTGEEDAQGIPIYREVANDGCDMGDEDRKVLAEALGIEWVHIQGKDIPAASDYRREYVARAEGRTPEVIGVPYWD